MRILLVEPYFGGSHASWAAGYAQASAHEVHLLTLPARFWKWRMQGAAFTLAEQAGALVSEHWRPTVVLASDMLDLPSFLGLARPYLGNPAVVLYMHENQISYPHPPGIEVDHSYGFTNWLSCVAADLVLFNSAYHRDEFFAVLPGLLGSLPDFRHVNAIAGVAEKAEVLPVGIDLERLVARPEAQGPPVILWNQRWEYDKDPASFFAAIFRLIDEGLDFRVILAGENFRNVPAEFLEAEERLGERLLHVGYAPAPLYVELLAQSDVVVSTALHEFFGVAVVEAIAAGAFPVLPRRLSYPELLPAAYHSYCLYEGADDLVARLQWSLQELGESRRIARVLAIEMQRYGWATVASAYDKRLARLVGSRE